MVDRQLFELNVENFRTLRKVTIPLSPLNVLVGPNGAGKSNVLEVFRFLADVIRTDLEPALALRGGFEDVVFRGGERQPTFFKVGLKAAYSSFSHSGAPDDYQLRVENRPGRSLSRTERFTYKRTKGQGRRITISGEKAVLVDFGPNAPEEQQGLVGLRRLSSGLSTFPRLADDDLEEPALFGGRLASFRVFDVDVAAARLPSRFPRGRSEPLDDDAANLAGFLLALRSRSESSFGQLVADARDVLPQLLEIEFEYPSGGAREVVVVLRERGLRTATQLADASYGMIRLLGLLALVYDPEPPAMTCVEEIDHGLHPQALELLVERLRQASSRTQFLIATHSPAMADRLKPDELVVCERRDDGSSSIPAVPPDQIRDIVRASEGLPLGELWFSGALGGDL